MNHMTGKTNIRALTKQDKVENGKKQIYAKKGKNI